MKLKSNEPFWLVKNGLIQSYPSLKENTETDYVIIGGGITGSLIAHQLTSEGYKVILVDRRDIANGSTSATTSMLQYEIDVPLYKLINQIGEKAAIESYWACYNSIDQLKEISEKIKSKSGYKKKDSLYFAAFKKDVKWLKEEYEARKKAGFPVKWIDANTIKSKYGINHTFGGILSKQGASLDAYQFTHDLLAYNTKKGLQVFDKTEISKFDYKTNSVTLTTEHGKIIKAKKVIFCNGFESTEIIKEKFVDLISTYAIVGEVNDSNLKHIKDLLIWNTADPYIYMRTTADNRILIGGEDKEFQNPEKRDQLIDKMSLKLTKELNKIYPENNFKVDFSWAGTFGTTKDGLPYIGEHPNFPSAIFVLGFGGNGITFSVVGMRLVSDILKGRKNSLLSHFRFKR